MTEHGPRYWHGGAPGLKPGDLLTPRKGGDHAHLVKGCRVCEARRQAQPVEEDDNDPSMVYVTTDRDYARIYAFGYPNGALYRVQPIGELSDREGHDLSTAWGCEAARILAVYDARVQMTEKEVRKLMAGYASKALQLLKGKQ